MAYPTITSCTPQEGTYLTSALPAAWAPGQTFSVNRVAGWTEVAADGTYTTVPLGQSGPFLIKVDAEQILCSELIGTTCVVYLDEATNGRGWNSSSIVAHAAGVPGGTDVTLIGTSVQSVATGGVGTVESTDGSLLVTSGSGPTANLSVSKTATILNKTGAYAMTGAERVVTATGAITLPAPATFVGIPYTIKDSGAGTASLLPHGAETIDGASSLSFSTAYEGATVSSNGTNWFVIGQVAAAIL